MPTDPRIATLTTGVNDELANRSIRHAVFLNQLGTQQANAVVSMLDKTVMPDLVRQLERRLATITRRGYDRGPVATRRLKALTASVHEILRGGIRAAGNQLKSDLKSIALTEAEFQVRMLAEVSSLSRFGFEFVMPAQRTLQSLVTSRPFEGRLLRDWFRGLERTTRDQIIQHLNIGLVSGETTQQIMRRISGTAGALNRTRHSAETLARTAVNHIATQARELTYAANSNLIKGIQIVATLDERTSEICISYDLQVYLINEGPRPPFHMKCRTTTVPYLRSWKELGINAREMDPGTRASMNGQVPASLSYPKWLKMQSRVIQDRVLGPSKAQLWRSGRYDIARPTRRPITLQELRKREGLPTS